ncbi:E3 ubiquitin-protein ligase [Thalictrum thalictroides]|uniref:E3 ubiquitin-protein ligase n=1 Tax=Thalictrum thalictroides TaxID=46969 RepID=A0A7J6WFR6_THATH|nr:E3 ubiquitin-protein ligase [Thalictrum thalictroides]
MVSVQESISSNKKKTIIPEIENSAGNNKRKWEGGGRDSFNLLSKFSKVETTKSILDIDFHLEKPLPLDWKQCLDVQSGQIHFYNTKTHKKTCKDPRQSPEQLSLAPISLDLELNLPCNSLRTTHVNDNWTKPTEPDSYLSMSITTSPRNSATDALKRCTSWTTFEEDHKEMVAAVCLRCNMLVMMCKSSPACPNCKFMHSPEQSPINLFKPRFSLLPCKDE